MQWQGRGKVKVSEKRARSLSVFIAENLRETKKDTPGN
jgi:hypothetical protein